MKRSPGVGMAWGLFLFREGCSFSLSRKLGALGSGFGGLIILIVPGHVHSFITDSFIQQMVSELSWGARLCVRLW